MHFQGLILGVILAAGLTQVVQAADALLDADSTADILNLARGYGSATLGTQDDGAPKIFGKIEGQPYTIYFESCDQASHKSCLDLDLYAGFSGSKPTLDRINQWNSANRYGHVYLDDDGDAGLDMDVNLEHGVSSDNLDSTLAIWTQLVKDFGKYAKAAN